LATQVVGAFTFLTLFWASLVGWNFGAFLKFPKENLGRLFGLKVFKKGGLLGGFFKN